MTMIERVARAMALADGEDYMEFHKEWDRRARAAVEEIRKPTPSMIEATHYVAVRMRLPTGEDYWKAMIDVALQEGKEAV